MPSRMRATAIVEEDAHQERLGWFFVGERTAAELMARGIAVKFVTGFEGHTQTVITNVPAQAPRWPTHDLPHWSKIYAPEWAVGALRLEGS